MPNIKGSFSIADNAARNGNNYGIINSASGVMSASSYNHNTVASTSYEVKTATVQDSVSLNFGGGQAHNNVTPAKAVYAWLRTA